MNVMNTGQEPPTDIEDAVRFLEWKRPGGPWPITAIVPDGQGTPTTWLKDAAEVRAFVAKHSGRANLHYTVAEVQSGVPRKPKKEHLVETDFLHADLDPPKENMSPAEIDAWISAEVERVGKLTTVPQPSLIACSGNGLHLLWRLDKPLFIGGTEERWVEVEARNRWLVRELSGDGSTWNCDRLLKLYGSINVPDAKKRKAGRERRATRIIDMNALDYPLAAFGTVDVEAKKPTSGGAATYAERDEVRRLADIAELEEWGIGEADRLRVLIVQGCDPDNFDGDRSKVVFDLCCNLHRRSVPPGLIAGIVSDPTWPISEHVIDKGKRDVPGYAWRQVEQAIKKVAAEGEPFQTDKDGKPYANQHNIRLALSKMGVAVRHDTFADRMLVSGLDGCGPHLDDAALDRLFLEIDGRFRFRSAWEFFVKVVVDAARRSAFHPVRDYLDGLRWDGTGRVDGWLSAYGGAADTPYTRAVGALMLVAAVRRVRQPGVKFDEMLVMESKQGTNKSTALRVIATRDEWFTDDLPLGAETKVFIERLAGRWIVEAAELKGMRKGEVEHLKNALSRQSDTARMAYARLAVIAPRQSVIFGTTNSERYLRDLTGNRRFWPVRVEGFDLDRLRADIDQLWAEAATREASGESIRLDPALWPAAEEEQEARRIEDPFALALAMAFGDQNGKISSHTVWSVLHIPVGQQTQEHNARVGDAMRELGFERKKLRFGGPSEWGYARGSEEEQRQFIVIDDGRREERAGDPY